MSLIMDSIPPFSHSTSSSAAYSHSHNHHHHHHHISPNNNSTATSTAPPGTSKPSPPPPPPYPAEHYPRAPDTPASRTVADRPSDISSDPSKHDPHHPSPRQRGTTARWHPAAALSSPPTHPYAAAAVAAHPPTHPTAWAPLTPRSDSGPGSASTPLPDPSRRLLAASSHEPPAPSPMSAVNYGVPAQYGALGIDEASLHNSTYQIDPSSYRQTMQPNPVVSQAYDFTQPDTYGTSTLRTSSPLPIQQQQPSYADEYRLSGAYDIPRTHASDAITRPLPPATLAAANPTNNYTSAAYQRSAFPAFSDPDTSSSLFRSTHSYDGAMYTHQMPPGPPLAGPLAGGNFGYGQPLYGASSLSSMPRSMSSVSAESVRGAGQKPKPQCWEHGCNGRKFSTFSNLLRHQREKSGTATKSYCPRCGAEFTRTTARNGHMAHDKCSKQRKASSEGRT